MTEQEETVAGCSFIVCFLAIPALSFFSALIYGSIYTFGFLQTLLLAIGCVIAGIVLFVTIRFLYHCITRGNINE